jgi:enoyl-CoA hydratase
MPPVEPGPEEASDLSSVSLTRLGRVRLLELVAPARRNALDRRILDLLGSALASVGSDPDAGALVVTGRGKSFCAGADLDDIFGPMPADVEAVRADLNQIYGAFLPIRDLSIPTIAAVNGAAVGAGLNIALACDVVLAAPEARFGPTFAAIGLHPGGGCTWMLAERVGPVRARRMLLTGEFVGADEAFRIGLCDAVESDVRTAALGLAATMAGYDAGILASIKTLTGAARTMGFEQMLTIEARSQAESVVNGPFAEVVAARRSTGQVSISPPSTGSTAPLR